jgi:putative nucleotidyltransferase with HDIG domain
LRRSPGIHDPAAPSGERLHPDGSREAFKLKALRDFTSGIARARDFDESLRIALMVLMGTFAVAKGALFLEEDGEYRVRAARGLPPGIPPVARSREDAALRRSRLPICVHRPGAIPTARAIASAVAGAIPAFRVETFCPFTSPRGLSGFLLLGPTLSGAGLFGLRRETLGVMTSILAAHIANRRIVLEVSRLNDVLRVKVRENAGLLRDMREIFLDAIRALAAAIEAKDPYTRGHSERVARISVAIARELGLSEGDVQAIRIASILHDVGKIATDSGILSKPDTLTRGEFREIRRHPRTSYDILSEIRFPFPHVASLALHHHERVDGTGYPDGKRDREIPMGSRIIAVADAFDAMVSDRPYRSGIPALKALREIRDDADRHFDPVVVRTFFRILRRELGGGNGAVLLPERSGPGWNGSGRARVLEFLDGALSEVFREAGRRGSHGAPRPTGGSAPSGAAPRSGRAGPPRPGLRGARPGC